MSSALTPRQLARAALVVLLGFAASGLLGLLRQSAIAATFGTSAALDSYFAAQRIPEILFVLVAGGALGSSFIPVFSRALQEGDDPWRLASSVMTLTLLAALVLAVVIAIFAEPLVALALAPEAAPERRALVVDLTRIMLLTVPVFAVSGLMMGILNVHQRFTLPALAAAMYNVGQIVGALVLARAWPPLTLGTEVSANVYGLAWGVVFGALLHLLIQVPGLLRLPNGLRLYARLTSGARSVLLLMLPRVLGLAVVQINFIVNVALAYPPSMAAGSVSAFTVAWQLMFFALGVVAQSVGTALFPSLSALAAASDWDGFRGRLSGAVRAVLFLALPATAVMLALGEPVIRALFERGAWTRVDSAATAWALAFLAIGVSGHALLELLARAFYALADTRTPVGVGVGAMLANIALSLLFIRFVGSPQDLARGAFAGLALANSLTTLAEAAVLWMLLRRRVGALHEARVLASTGRALLAALAVVLVVPLFSAWAEAYGVWAQVLGGGTLAGLVYFGLALALRAEEAAAMVGIVTRRLRRGSS